MYEVEFKVELTAKEREGLLVTFKEKQFPFVKTTKQNDFYIQAEKSPYSGYDLKRYRDEDGTYMYTEKIWEMIDGQPFRKEDEHEVLKEEFTSTVKKFPNAVIIEKQRDWFAGKENNQNISITIDSVKFGHSPAMRYFMEGEIDTEDKTKVKETKAMIQEFLRDLLGKKEVTESPGMFTMAFEKR